MRRLVDADSHTSEVWAGRPDQFGARSPTRKRMQMKPRLRRPDNGDWMTCQTFVADFQQVRRKGDLQGPASDGLCPELVVGHASLTLPDVWAAQFRMVGALLDTLG
ncbi:unnamed protein product [Protopolystoma xenopodis]|uniref:Uncharacterized protein n=1 Tax=Protopolystoma xenopodis TaxID=117903 RepID=A0A448XQ24_9PLAT|nr:unnamed protein product [Protopolystoma xenopodis]